MLRVCSFTDFSTISKNRKVFLIGAGKQARSLLEKYDWDVFCCIDNDAGKQGTYMNAHGKGIPVYGWDYLVRNASPGSIILITPNDFSSLLEKIEGDDSLKACDCYIAVYMSAMQWDEDRIAASNVPFTIIKGTVPKIPKIIHYFWFSGDPYPEKVQKCLDSWHKYCPGYEFRKWDLHNYKTDNQFVKDALENKDWAHASDFGRCDVVYRYGGVYLDTDVELVKPLDDLLYDTGFFCFESSYGVDPGSGFGAEANNPIIKEICEAYNVITYKKADGISWNPVDILKIYTDPFVKRGLTLNAQYQNIEGFAIYPPLVLSPYSYRTGILASYEKTYGIHHWVSAWITEKQMKDMTERKAFIQKCLTGNLD